MTTLRLFYLLAILASTFVTRMASAQTDSSTSFYIQPAFHSGYMDSMVSAHFILRSAIGGFTAVAFDSITRVESGFLPARMIPVATIREVGDTIATRRDTLPANCQDNLMTFHVTGSEAGVGGYAWVDSTSDTQYLSIPWNGAFSDTLDSLSEVQKGDTTFFVVAYNGNYQSIPDTVTIPVKRIVVNFQIGKITDTAANLEQSASARIPVILMSSDTNLDFCHPDSMRLMVHLNKTTFRVDSLSKGTLGPTTMNGSDQVLTLNIPVSYTIKQGDIATEIVGHVLLGNDTNTTILDSTQMFPDPDSWYTTGVPAPHPALAPGARYPALWYRYGSPYYYVTGTVDSGTITLEVCDCGGQRLLDYPTFPPLSIAPVMPNPATVSATALISYRSAGTITVAIYSIDGELLSSSAIDAPLPSGQTQSSITASLPVERLANGTYELMAREGGVSQAEKFVINH